MVPSSDGRISQEAAPIQLVTQNHAQHIARLTPLDFCQSIQFAPNFWRQSKSKIVHQNYLAFVGQALAPNKKTAHNPFGSCAVVFPELGDLFAIQLKDSQVLLKESVMIVHLGTSAKGQPVTKSIIYEPMHRKR
jgi:hypothetical protein